MCLVAFDKWSVGLVPVMTSILASSLRSSTLHKTEEERVLHCRLRAYVTSGLKASGNG